MSFFEGSEKKLEVVVDLNQSSIHSLIDLGEAFWAELVQSAQAQILSKIESKKCVAYLLSESSLFVWENKFTMITCGQTTLAKSFLFFQKNVGLNVNVKSLIYERKNEMIPEDQRSCFQEDVDLFQELFQNKGQVIQFGSKSAHFIELYEFYNNFTPPEKDTTLELLMYDVSEPVRSCFVDSPEQKGKIRDLLRFKAWASKFKIDDYLFSPQGYSVNGLYEEEYFTIHVTPQKIGSYVSFETNMKDVGQYESLIDDLVSIFKPQSFDILDFKIKDGELVSDFPVGYQRISGKEDELHSGYTLSYRHMNLES